MKGNNTFHLNEATLIEAMQEYLDKRMLVYTPKVVSVRLSGEVNNSFEVEVEEVKKAAL
ncbi:MAG: hypothetical protein U1E51_12590 [Candidatus Binatia bacterium]|nr:hypothetical protein [Candidatus Binatia bacterium]